MRLSFYLHHRSKDSEKLFPAHDPGLPAAEKTAELVSETVIFFFVGFSAFSHFLHAPDSSERLFPRLSATFPV